MTRLQAETASELEALLPAILGGLHTKEIEREPDACAARLAAAASPDLRNMGLGIVSFTIQSRGKECRRAIEVVE